MSEDRKWIINEYLPNLNGKILYVGTADYTKNYHSYIPTESIWHTIELDSEADGGSNVKHFNGNFLDYDFEDKYEHVSLYGLWGQPHSFTNELEEIKKFIDRADDILNINGTIMLGPRWKDGILSAQDCYNIFNYCTDKKYSKLFETKVGSNVIYWGRKTC